MIRRINGTFRSVQPGPGINVFDSGFTATGIPNGASGRTNGATIVDTLTLFPTNPRNSWEILGFSVGAQLIAQVSAAGAFGRLGKIVCGLTTDIYNQSGNATVPYDVPVQPLPSDLSLVGDLWNPANDPMPPGYGTFLGAGGTPDKLQISLSDTLPQHIPVPRGGGEIRIGIWILPSIMSSTFGSPTVALAVVNAIWSVVYDDGNPNALG